MDNENKERQKELALSLNEVQKKIDTVEEKYFLSGEMAKETYEKFMQKLSKVFIPFKLTPAFRGC